MITPPSVPLPPGLTRRYGGSAKGRAWLASLPQLIAHCLAQWQLVPDLAPGSLPWHGHGAVVVRGGRGAALVLAGDPEAGALLLERLDAERPLQDVPLADAVDVWGALVRQLSLLPDDRPEWHEFDQIAARAEQWSDELPESWERLGRPFPRWLLEAALEVCQTRGAVGRRSGTDVLVHTDLHFLNILARPGTAARPGGFTAAQFKAIDPQPLVGEAEFAVAPLLWNRLAELPRSGPGEALLERCFDFSAAE